MRQFMRFVLVELMRRDEFGKRRAIDAPRHVVTGGNRRKGARVVVEADRIGEARGLRRQIAETAHAGDEVRRQRCFFHQMQEGAPRVQIARDIACGGRQPNVSAGPAPRIAPLRSAET